jgi:hypothetical protein
MSPVDVALEIRKDLAKFQRTLTPQAYRAALRAACEITFLQAFGYPGAPPFAPVEIEQYLEERGLIRNLRRYRQRRRRRQDRLASPAPTPT